MDDLPLTDQVDRCAINDLDNTFVKIPGRNVKQIINIRRFPPWFNIISNKNNLRQRIHIWMPRGVVTHSLEDRFIIDQPLLL